MNDRKPYERPNLIRLKLCPACADQLRRIQASLGLQPACVAAGSIVAKCPQCSRQLPAELVQSILAGETVTQFKGPEA